MSGFHRIQQRPSPRRFALHVAVEDLLGDLLAAENAPLTRADPFGVDDPCPENPVGHYPIRDRNEVVCAHCSRILWR
jgi:hypothetical protein